MTRYLKKNICRNPHWRSVVECVTLLGDTPMSLCLRVSIPPHPSGTWQRCQVDTPPGGKSVRLAATPRVKRAIISQVRQPADRVISHGRFQNNRTVKPKPFHKTFRKWTISSIHSFSFTKTMNNTWWIHSIYLRGVHWIRFHIIIQRPMCCLANYFRKPQQGPERTKKSGLNMSCRFSWHRHEPKRGCWSGPI